MIHLCNKNVTDSLEPPKNLNISTSASFPSANLPVVSLTSSSSTSSSCTQLAGSSSSNSTETGDEINGANSHGFSIQNTDGNVRDHFDKNEILASERGTSCNDDKQFFNNVSDTVTEPLLAIKCVGSKIYNNADGIPGKPSIANNGVRSSVVRGLSSSPTKVLDDGRKVSDLNTALHKNSIIDYKNEARNRDQIRNNWSDSNVRKTSKHNERRQSISSEESLSDYEELGGGTPSINGGIGLHRNSRYYDFDIPEK